MLALNCGKIFKADAHTFSAIAVTVIFPPASCALGPKRVRNCSSSVISALSFCVTWGIELHAELAGETTYMRRCRNRAAMLNSGGPIEVERHAESGDRSGSRLVRR